MKLLEITDQPLGYAAMKKKRKQEVDICIIIEINHFMLMNIQIPEIDRTLPTLNIPI